MHDAAAHDDAPLYVNSSENGILNLFDLELSNQYFHWTLWLMMIYHQTQFGCEWIMIQYYRQKWSSLFYRPSLTLTLIATLLSFFSHDILAHDDHHSNKLNWLQKVDKRLHSQFSPFNCYLTVVSWKGGLPRKSARCVRSY